MVAGMRLSLFAIRAAVARRGITPVACYAAAVPLWHFYFSVQLLFHVLDYLQLVLICSLYEDRDNRVKIVYCIKKNTNAKVLAIIGFFLDNCNYDRFNIL